MPTPGGYCLSFCGPTGEACDGACVESTRGGDLCARRCASDAECRVAEGYRCDPQWKACLLPGMAALPAPTCPSAGARDPAFAPSDALSTEHAPGIYQFEPSAVALPDGSIAILYGTRGAMPEGNALGWAHAARPGAAPATIDQAFRSDRASHFDPWLARDASGALYAVWLGFDGRGSERQQIGFATSSDAGATWSAPSSAHDPADCAGGEPDCLDKPMVLVGPEPRATGREILYVMYAGHDAGLRVRASRDRGKTFGPTTTALDGIYGNAAISGDGRLHLVSLNGGPQAGLGSTEHKVEYTVSADAGATFRPPVTVSGAGESLPFFFSNPAIAVDDRRGWIYVAYTRGGHDAAWDIAVAASHDGGQTWTRTRLGDDPACALHLVPNVALDPTTGTLHVAWYDSRGTGRFAHATCPVGAARCTQRGAINDRPFAAISTERHGAKWLGEYESLIVDDRHRVLHAVWTQPVAEAKGAIARIFHASAPLPAR